MLRLPRRPSSPYRVVDESRIKARFVCALSLQTPFVPAKAGTQGIERSDLAKNWVPACAGTNG
jgi:hypothetical protein